MGKIERKREEVMGRILGHAGFSSCQVCKTGTQKKEACLEKTQ